MTLKLAQGVFDNLLVLGSRIVMSSSDDRNCIRTERQLGFQIPRGGGALQ